MHRQTAGSVRRYTAWAVVAAALFNACAASARDLGSLSSLLVPAYTAMNFAAICSSVPGWQELQPQGPRGAAVNYAEHVKDEITAALSYDEAVTVLRGA